MSAPRRQLVVATRNEHKLSELSEVLTGFDLLPLDADIVLPPEDGSTFAENSLGKARAASAATGLAAIADDSGIAAAALEGRPGVHSARYAGRDASDAENLSKLLEEVGRHDDRSVAYVCAMAYVGSDGRELVTEGRCAGTLARSPRGDGGFGYDPAFIPDDDPDGDARTMAELSAEEKHAISHRGRAAQALAEILEGKR
jgi:XTP/dITP diphosphohydrolase